MNSRCTFQLRQESLLAQACWLLALGFALNAGYTALHFGFGFGEAHFLPGPGDRFADLVKVALSFKEYTAGLAATPEFHAWPAIYKNYLLHNPYQGADGLSAGRLTHLHHPALSQLSFNICAMLIALTKSVTSVLWAWFGLYAACVAWLATTYIKCIAGKRLSAYPLLVLCFASYPALLVFARANYHAGFSSILIAVFLVSCFGQRKVSWSAILAIAMAMNFRPVASIFLLAIPLLLGWRKSIVPLATTVTLAASIFIAALAAENAIYPDYDLHNFLMGLENYAKLYIVGPYGDGGNASLWALTKNGAIMIDDTYFYHDELNRLFMALSALVILLSWRSMQAATNLTQTGPLALVALYVLLSPICAEYHLLVCLAPLTILSLHENVNSLDAKIVFGASVLMLIPKNYLFIHGISIQTILNPMTFLIALALLQGSGKARFSKDNVATV